MEFILHVQNIYLIANTLFSFLVFISCVGEPITELYMYVIYHVYATLAMIMSHNFKISGLLWNFIHSWPMKIIFINT